MFRPLLGLILFVIVLTLISLFLKPAWVFSVQIPNTCDTPINSVVLGGLVTINATGLPHGLSKDAQSKCVINNSTVVPAFAIPVFTDLKSLYYDQIKEIFGEINKVVLGPSDLLKDKIVLNQSTLITTTNPLTVDQLSFSVDPNDKTLAIVFVDSTLTINSNIQQSPSSLQGLVFIVSGDVHIAPSVTRLDAFIITYGQFCSQWNGSACPIGANNNLLTINGSVIALNTNLPPQFVRSLTSNTNPAEIINYQPKYLVTLRNLMGQDTKFWTEIQ